MRCVPTSLLIGLLMALPHVADASTYKFQYDTRHVYQGTPVISSGTLTVSDIEASGRFDVEAINGTFNGSTITGLIPGGFHFFLGSIKNNNENIMAETQSGQGFNFNYDLAISSDNQVIGTFSVSAVPLPSSAPMFGAALLGLAGLGYAAKRKAKTTG